MFESHRPDHLIYKGFTVFAVNPFFLLNFSGGKGNTDFMISDHNSLITESCRLIRLEGPMSWPVSAELIRGKYL